MLDWNSAARGFYESLGAVAMDEWTVHRLTGPALRACGGRRYSTAGDTGGSAADGG